MAATVSGAQADSKFRIQQHCRGIVAGSAIVRRGKTRAAVSPQLPLYYICRRTDEKIIATGISCLWLAGAGAQENRWITFKTGHNDWGRIEYQIDRNSIRQEGRYKIFWSRIWLDKKHQAMVFNRNEVLVFLSQKFAVDCAQRRFGNGFIDSNEPAEMKHKASLQTMRWETMDKVPAVGRAVCGDK